MNHGNTQFGSIHAAHNAHSSIVRNQPGQDGSVGGGGTISIEQGNNLDVSIH